MNELVNEKRYEIAKQLGNYELTPIKLEQDFSLQNTTKVSMIDIASLGSVFTEVAKSLGTSAGSGLYKVTLPAGTHLAEKGTEYIGAALSNSSNQLVGQARLNPAGVNPLMANPYMLMIAVALKCIDKKLTNLLEGQEAMMDFLLQQEKATQRSNLNMLTEIINNYKYNWDNELFIKNNHMKVLDIKQEAERSIELYKSNIASIVRKQSFLHMEKKVDKMIERTIDDFQEYKLALYIYSFASFVDVMLLQNFSADFLEGITNRIEGCGFDYRELYTTAYNMIENYSKTSLEKYAVKGASFISKATGDFSAKIPLVKKAQLDDKLGHASEAMLEFNDTRHKKTMEQLTSSQDYLVKPFIESINTMSDLYNKPLELVYDKDNIYIEMK